jgi:hypothetical protein
VRNSVESGRSSQNQSSTRRSLPPVRGLRNMFSMEPIVHLDSRPKRDGLPPDKPLPMAPNEFGMMVRPPAHDGFAQHPNPAVVCLNSPPPVNNSLPGKMPFRSSTPRKPILYILCWPG